MTLYLLCNATRLPLGWYGAGRVGFVNRFFILIYQERKRREKKTPQYGTGFDPHLCYYSLV